METEQPVRGNCKKLELHLLGSGRVGLNFQPELGPSASLDRTVIAAPATWQLWMLDFQIREVRCAKSLPSLKAEIPNHPCCEQAHQ